MSSFRQKFLNLKYEYKKVVKAFQFVKWALKNSTINGETVGFPVPKCGVVDINVTDGVNPVTPDAVSVVGNTVTIEVPKDLELLVPYSTGDTTATFTIVTGSAGIISSANTTGLTSVTYEVNATPETLPLTLVVGDVVTIDFDAAAADGVIILTGTYA